MDLSSVIRTLKIARANKVSTSKKWYGYWLGVADSDISKVDNFHYRYRAEALIENMIMQKRRLKTLVRAEKEALNKGFLS